MRETAFYRYLVEELKTLLSDIEAGLNPSNDALDSAVREELMKQFDRLKKVA